MGSYATQARQQCQMMNSHAWARTRTAWRVVMAARAGGVVQTSSSWAGFDRVGGEVGCPHPRTGPPDSFPHNPVRIHQYTADLTVPGFIPWTLRPPMT